MPAKVCSQMGLIQSTQLEEQPLDMCRTNVAGPNSVIVITSSTLRWSGWSSLAGNEGGMPRLVLTCLAARQPDFCNDVCLECTSKEKGVDLDERDVGG
eukprot:3125127-Amphidinium_carterae.1